MLALLALIAPSTHLPSISPTTTLSPIAPPLRAPIACMRLDFGMPEEEEEELPLPPPPAQVAVAEAH